MGGALLRGLIRCGVCREADITVTAKTEATLDRYKDLGVERTTDNKGACERADMIVIAVKPWLVEEILREICPTESQLLVVLAAGVDDEDLIEWAEGGTGIVKLIPNTAIEVGESMSFLSNVSASPEQLELVKGIFDKMGSTLLVDSKHLSAGTKLASCGIAFAMRYIRASMEGGVELGFRAEEAKEIVLQTVAGAAALLKENGAHPEAEIDKVTTAGGMTIRGLNEMERSGFTAAVVSGLKAC